jgi:hypothetical protein
MGHSLITMITNLSKSDKIKIWSALSDNFVDTNVDYDSIVERIHGFDLKVLEEIFFCEVAPICGPNLMTATPPIWTGFDGADIAKDIELMLEKRSRSVLFKLRNNAFIFYCRCEFSDDWNLKKNLIIKTYRDESHFQ